MCKLFNRHFIILLAHVTLSHKDPIVINLKIKTTYDCRQRDGRDVCDADLSQEFVEKKENAESRTSAVAENSGHSCSASPGHFGNKKEKSHQALARQTNFQSNEPLQLSKLSKAVLHLSRKHSYSKNDHLDFLVVQELFEVLQENFRNLGL